MSSFASIAAIPSLYPNNHMKSDPARFLVATALLLIAGSRLAAQATTRSEVPPIVTHGLDTLAAGGLEGALAVWAVGSPGLADPTSRANVLASLNPVLLAYGKATGGEVLGAIPIGSRVERVYVVLFFERGPLFGYVDAFRTATGWVVLGFLTNTRAQEVLPASLLELGGRTAAAASTRP